MSSMLLLYQAADIDGYLVSDEMTLSPLAVEGNVEWVLCRDNATGEAFTLAMPACDEAGYQITRRLKNEYALRDALSEQWALKPLGYTQYQGRYALMYPAFSWRTLSDTLCLPAGSLVDFLRQAILLTSALSQMHQSGLVHGDIKPAHFFIVDDERYLLGGFGLTTAAAQAQQPPLPITGGTLAYMSPEHTSRTADPVSSLSDLYSLGIVLYELLTGRLPYGNLDGGQAEWVHHHIASEPLPPHRLRQDVPVVLSAIIMRLLAKSPETRYQTAEGLLADLYRCQSNLMPDGLLTSFSLGQQDTQRNGLISDALCSEHPQAADILSAYNEVYSSGKHALVVIAGPPGSGKSSLMASSLKILQHKQTLLTVVKADQHSPVLPYAVFTAAFRTLALHLLGFPAAEMQRWKMHILRQMGEYAGLAVSIIPELGVLLGQKATSLTELHSLDARDKFNCMACNLVKAFATPGRPLVMLIDDVHWADQATFQVLQNLLSLSDDIPLLLVLSHRDENSLPCPTACGNLARLRASASRITDITPEPLSVKTIARLLAGQFHIKTSDTTELAALLHEKTGGNPQFTHELFRQAVKDGLIGWQKPTKWSWDRPAIMAFHYSDNVASGIVARLESLPAPTRQLLGQLACIGGAGDTMLAAHILGLPVTELVARLTPAATARFISLTDTKYAFMHTSVLEAATGLLPVAEKDALHHFAACTLADMAGNTISSEPLFRAVHHIGAINNIALLSPDAEPFAALIHKAVKRAKITGDYASALRFLHTAHQLNELIGPDTRAAFMLEEAECEFLNGNLSAARDLCGTLLSAPGDLADKAVAACLMAEIHMRQSDSQLALETAISWLAVFGIQLNRHPDKAECDAARLVLKADVGKNPYTRFRNLTKVTCRETEAVMNLMASASTYAAFISPRLQFMILCKLLHLTMARGISGASTFALSWYGVLCGDHYDEYSRGFASTLLARQLVYKHDFASFKARTLLPLDQVSIWTMPVTYAIDQAKATFDVAVETGDRTSACLALRHIVMNYLTRGDHLDGVQTSIERALSYVRKAQYRDVEVILLMQRDYVQFLRLPGTEAFSGHHFTPPVLRVAASGGAVEPIFLMQFWAGLYKGKAHFFAGEYACASRWLAEADALIELIPGHIHMLDFHLYSALALSVPLSPETVTDEALATFQRHLDKVTTWCAENTKTFSDKAALLQAERLRLKGDAIGAAEKYETALALARDGQFHPIQALACELAARLATTTGMRFAAEAYIKGAINAWERWGAGAKVRQLESRYPQLTTQGSQTALDTRAFEQNAVLSDVQGMANAIRALTEEINLNRLINTLMMMLVERAGAQHCLLIRLIDGNIPEIQARATTTADGIKVSIVKETPLATDLPLSVLAAVIRTGQEIRTGKPEAFSPFSQDHYLVASGAAVMCVPMFKQGQMVGVLYLENRLLPDVFTAEHSRIVSMLGAQAAVSLETARLYAELVDENIQRRKVEKQLRASQKSLMLGEKISHTGTWHWHLEQDIMLLSEEYTRIVGLPAHQGSLSMADFMTRVHPDDFSVINDLVTRSVRNGQPMQAEFRIIRTDGVCRYIKGIGEPVENWPEVKEYFGTISDITAQRNSEDAVRIAQADLARVARATTVGQLTASIAHEINQPLMSIVANAGAALRWLKRDPQHLENACKSITDVISEGNRAGEIIRGLQALTRNQEAEFAQARLHGLARNIHSLSRLEMERRAISLELDFQAVNDRIFCVSVQIQQVLLNLVINAMDAMADNDGVRTLRLSSSQPDAGTIQFDVVDNGSGLTDALIERIFDSFFTTKAEGMGMGLTISAEIIKRHGGKLRAASRDSGGSIFSFTLPVQPEDNA